jgi:hypothetical protein
MTAARRLAQAALALALGGCASSQPPPGGPPDVAAPELIGVTPDTGSVGVRPPKVIFRFDEVVSERPQGVATLSGLFMISPRDGEPRVDWDREAIEVRPRRGWRPNTVYTVTMLPGLADLRSNVRKEGATAVFSTGPTIPDTRVTGTAFDWIVERPLPRAFVEALTPDSVAYITTADSLGGFTFRHLPPGRYLVRAWNDANTNRTREPREAYDSATVNVIERAGADTTAAPTVELLAFVHDTLPPRVQAVTVRDSITLRVEFDKPLQVGTRLTRSDFTLRRGPDSAVVAIAFAEPARDADARATAERDARARADTSGRADSLRRARQADSTRMANDALRPLPPNVVATARPPADTARGPRPSRRAPDIAYEVRTVVPLAPATTYRLLVTGARSLLGYTRPADRAFTTPKPDTTRAPAARDSASRRDSTARDTTARPPLRIRRDSAPPAPPAPAAPAAPAAPPRRR